MNQFCNIKKYEKTGSTPNGTTVFPPVTVYDPCEHLLTNIEYGDGGYQDIFQGSGSWHKPRTTTPSPFRSSNVKVSLHGDFPRIRFDLKRSTLFFIFSEAFWIAHSFSLSQWWVSKIVLVKYFLKSFLKCCLDGWVA